MVNRREFLSAGAVLFASSVQPATLPQTGTGAERKAGRILYTNPFASERDVRGFQLEGDAAITFPNNRLRMTSLRDPKEGQAANFVYWCPEEFPGDIEVTWEFSPIKEPGLSILFFAATGRKDEDIFDKRLTPRTGPYDQYHHGDIDALHISYFRRTQPAERAFHTCNLRKSYGFYLVAQGADPIPSVEDAQNPYKLRLVKFGGAIDFFINDLPILHWVDDGQRYGRILGGGKIGFRQMAPLVAEYGNFVVRALEQA